jgi:hypothetical protein
MGPVGPPGAAGTSSSAQTDGQRGNNSCGCGLGGGGGWQLINYNENE